MYRRPNIIKILISYSDEEPKSNHIFLSTKEFLNAATLYDKVMVQCEVLESTLIY